MHSLFYLEAKRVGEKSLSKNSGLWQVWDVEREPDSFRKQAKSCARKMLLVHVGAGLRLTEYLVWPHKYHMRSAGQVNLLKTGFGKISGSPIGVKLEHQKIESDILVFWFQGQCCWR